MRLKRRAAVARYRETAHQHPGSRLGRAVEVDGPVRRVHRPGRVPARQQRGSVARQSLDRPLPPQRALRGEPMLELRRAGNGEPFEELPRHQRRGGAPILPARCLLEALGVEARGVGRQAHLPVIGRDAALPRETAQQLERHAQRPPGVLLGLVPPEEADQVLPRPSALWGPCQVDEQRQVLAPLQLAGCGSPVQEDLHGPEGVAGDHAGHLSSR